MIQFVSEYLPSHSNTEIRKLVVFNDDEQNETFGILTFVKGTQYVISEKTIEDTISSHRLMKSIDNEYRN